MSDQQLPVQSFDMEDMRICLIIAATQCRAVAGMYEKQTLDDVEAAARRRSGDGAVDMDSVARVHARMQKDAATLQEAATILDGFKMMAQSHEEV